jgi:hypothetical protein
MTEIADVLRALRSLRLNYRWRGVWVWLRAEISAVHAVGAYLDPCGARHRGWWWVVHEPKRVRAYQLALAEGVTA